MIIDEIEAIIEQRRGADPSASYTAQLLNDPVLAQRKIMEEAFEVCLELQQRPSDKERLANESADLFYHLVVAINGAGISFADVAAVLEGRRA